MNLLDLILTLIIVASIWRGVRRGFLEGFIHVIVLLISLVATLLVYPYILYFFSKHLEGIKIIFPLALIIGFLLMRVLVVMLVDQLFDVNQRNEMVGNSVSRLLGFLPGFVEGLIYSVFIILLLISIPDSRAGHQVQTSAIAKKVQPILSWVDVQTDELKD